MFLSSFKNTTRIIHLFSQLDFKRKLLADKEIVGLKHHSEIIVSQRVNASMPNKRNKFMSSKVLIFSV